MYKITRALLLSLIILSAVGVQDSFSQAKKPKSKRDEIRKSAHKRDSLLQTLGKTDTSVNELMQHTSQYITNFNQINNNLAEGLDTTEVSEQLPLTGKRIAKIQQLANTKKSSTLRYLFVLRDNLDHLQDKLEGWQASLDDVNTKLVQNEHDILRCGKDTLLNIVPQDRALRAAFFERLAKLREIYKKTSALNRTALLKVNLLQNKVSVDYSAVLDETDQIDVKVTRFFNRAVDGEFNYIWDIDPSYSGLSASVDATLALNQTQLYYFVKNELPTNLLALTFLVLMLFWMFYNKVRASRNIEHPESILGRTNYIYTHAAVSALLLFTVITPYIYDHPPVSFLEIMFFTSAVLVLVIVKKSFPVSLYNFLLQLFVIAVLYGLSNLLIQITNFDRFFILGLSAVSILVGIRFYKSIKREPDGHLSYTHLALILFILLEIVSLLLNLLGRFSLAKIVGITAVFNLWLLVCLYFVIQIIIQGVFLQFHAKQDHDSFVNWIDYNTLQKRFQSVLSTLAGALWIFFLLQNLNIDDFVHDYFVDVLNQSRSIGGASFTFGGFVIFIVVIWISTLLSKMISYFYDVAAQHASDLTALKKKNRASTLLIRIGVFTVGFLLAVAASGFPIDKLTIIFSAFGVGIGFGLQNIVNNLVSGMILAFEKPVQIGDIIEVGGHVGTIKEIGIRSSKIATGDGSEVIIPNGDLISQQVTNWTLSNTNRRVEFIVSTAYGTDIENVKTMLTDLLCKRDDIMDKPEPNVLLNGITDKSVDFRVSFWAADISNAQELKSRVLTAIYSEFNKQGIKLPTS